MLDSKKLFGNNIIHSCSYCQNSVVESETEFCKVKKKIGPKGKCPKFVYNPTMRKVNLKALEEYSAEDFSL